MDLQRAAMEMQLDSWPGLISMVFATSRGCTDLITETSEDGGTHLKKELLAASTSYAVCNQIVMRFICYNFTKNVIKA